MKKTIRTILSSLALIALISCGGHISSGSEDNSSVIPDSSGTSISSEENTSTSDLSSDSSSASSIEATYHVRFVNYDDALLYETDVLEGHTAEYVGDTPTKPEDDEFTYTFKEWDQDLSSITSDLTTKAVYTPVGKINWGPIIRP